MRYLERKTSYPNSYGNVLTHPKNDAKYISSSHDYVLMYAKQLENFQIGRLPRTEEANVRYKNPDNALVEFGNQVICP